MERNISLNVKKGVYMSKNEQLAEEISECLLVDFNYLSQKPLFFNFSNIERGDPMLEMKITQSGEFLKKKLFNSILTILNEKDKD